MKFGDLPEVARDALREMWLGTEGKETFKQFEPDMVDGFWQIREVIELWEQYRESCWLDYINDPSTGEAYHKWLREQGIEE